MDMEIKKLMKLKFTEQSLAALLQKLDTEINQTDVQWMHLRSLVPSVQNVAPQPESNELTQTMGSSETTKMGNHVDDQSVNETKLDLSLGITKTDNSNISDEEEEMSD